MRLYISCDSPHRYARVTGQGAVRQVDEVDSLESLPRRLKGDDVWVVLPGEQVVTAEVAVPARNRRQLARVLPFALEDQLTEDVDSLHFVPIAFTPGTSAVAAVVSRELVREVRSTFEAAGLSPTALVADYQLLPVHPGATMTVAATGGGRIAVLDARGTGAVLDAASLELWWQSSDERGGTIAVNDAALGRRLAELGGEDVRQWEIGTDFTGWLAHRAPRSIVPNLMPRLDGERRAARIPAMRSAAALLLLAAALRLAADGYEYVRLEQAHARLTGETHTLFRELFPEEARIVDVRSQFRSKLAELGQQAAGQGEFQFLLSVLAPAAGRGVTVEEISFRDGALEVACEVGNFSEIDRLRERMAGRGVAVELVGSGSLADRVTGRLRLSREQG